MQFYKISGEFILNENDEKETKIELSQKIALKTTQFNENNNNSYCFLSEMKDNKAVLGIICSSEMNLSEFVKKFGQFIEVGVNMSHSNEITFSTMQRLLRAAKKSSLIDDYDQILEKFELNRICGSNSSNLVFGENLVNEPIKEEELLEKAQNLFLSDTLIPELERIRAGGKMLGIHGHPVHYIIECDNRDTRREAYKILLDALYANVRIGSSRYSFLDFRPRSSYSKVSYETLYKISDGGAVVVRYLADEESEDDFYTQTEDETIENICEMAKKYRNSVLTILCFPRDCKSVKAKFYENLGNMSFIEIKENLIDFEGAKITLNRFAKEKGMRADKSLFAMLGSDGQYLSDELNAIFDDWYNKKLKNVVYPQYKNIAIVRKETINAEPRGTAYDELMEMVGLEESKQVIKKALNYYKIQKLYEEKGIKTDSPALHMIFTGNPGTAKTTVARLFARIMKENGLLSRGQLIEVGRGDLVGKYVGWTAKTVQQKFREASGGVLFIDEAYSLVDYHNGSFGDEAISTIVQEMENHRSDVVVIFAGYPDKMEDFLQKNPGLRSRIAFHIPFSDYNSNELCEIADLIIKKNGMRIEQDALDKLRTVFEKARAKVDFGNGRYVRNVFEQAKMNQASRILQKDFDSLTDNDIITITYDDIIVPEEKTAEKRAIGFC